MIEIKFRGQRIDNNEWVYGCLADYMRGSGKCIMPDSFFATKDFGEINENGTPKIEDTMAIGGFIPVKPETVGQYTGLKDKHGKEVYEGDICEIRYNNEIPTVSGVVEWFSSHSHFSIKTNHGGPYSISFGGSIIDGVYVVSNIHDTPELLTN